MRGSVAKDLRKQAEEAAKGAVAPLIAGDANIVEALGAHNEILAQIAAVLNKHGDVLGRGLIGRFKWLVFGR